MAEDNEIKKFFISKLSEVFPGYQPFGGSLDGCDMVIVNQDKKKFIEFKGGNPSNPRWLEKKQFELAEKKGEDYCIVRWKNQEKKDIVIKCGLGKGFSITKEEIKYWFRLL